MCAGSHLKLPIVKESPRVASRLESCLVFYSRKVVYKEKSRIELSVEKLCTRLSVVYSKKPSSRKIAVKHR